MSVFSKQAHIWNWRVESVEGRRELTLLVLHEAILELGAEDVFANEVLDRVRVYRVAASVVVCEVWEQRKFKDKLEWVMVDVKPLLRAGRPLLAIPFVFVGS